MTAVVTVGIPPKTGEDAVKTGIPFGQVYFLSFGKIDRHSNTLLYYNGHLDLLTKLPHPKLQRLISASFKNTR